jgi:3-phenylpropionate/trans-cinnamate dioxygenase ferredoxin reductase subunit
VRDLADADALKPEFVAGRKLLVIGGGYTSDLGPLPSSSAGLSFSLK